MISINGFFFSIYSQIRNFYLNSNCYDKKISKFETKDLIYKPSPHFLSSLVKYQRKKILKHSHARPRTKAKPA